MNTLLNRLRKSTTVTETDVLSESKFFADKDMIPTPVPALNIALSGRVDGGLTPGLTTFAGPSKHFKTAFTMILAQSYLKKYPDSVLLFYDSEFGSPQSYFESFDIPLDRVLHTPITDIEMLKHDIMVQLEQVKRGDKLIIVVDSIGNLASKKEVDDALEGKSVADMTRAKQLKSLFRMVTPHLAIKDIPMVVINHTYKEISMFPKDIVAGGCVVAGTKISMRDGSFKNIEDIIVGDFVKTPDGTGEVKTTWNPETLIEGNPECLRIEFEDGTEVICSRKHSFVIGDSWVTAEDLVVGDDVQNLERINTSGIKPNPETYYAHSLSNQISKSRKRE